jgi:hypothetical protein
MTRRRKLCQAPMAVTSDGAIFVNLAHLLTPNELRELRLKLAGFGGHLFIGVEVPRRLQGQVQGEVRDVLEDVVGRLGPGLRGRR